MKAKQTGVTYNVSNWARWPSSYHSTPTRRGTEVHFLTTKNPMAPLLILIISELPDRLASVTDWRVSDRLPD